jgi:hypothetical protein
MSTWTRLLLTASASILSINCGGSSTQKHSDASVPHDASTTTLVDASASVDQVATAFTPAALGGLSLWLDGDTVTMSGGKVTTWPDQSTHHNDAAQATAAAQPALTAAGSGINGHAVVTFDGASSYLSAADSASLQLDSTGFVVEAVVRYPSSTDGTPNIIYGKSNITAAPYGGPLLLLVHRTTTGNPAALGAQIDSTDSIYSSNGIADATPHRVRMRWIPDGDGGTGGTLGLQVDASLQEFTTHLASLADIGGSGVAAFIGCSPFGATQFYKGDLAALVVVKGPIDDADQQDLDTYFSTRFGL